ncbi:unnamed protein product, partial [Nesidiocoris tenuis]
MVAVHSLGLRAGTYPPDPHHPAPTPTAITPIRIRDEGPFDPGKGKDDEYPTGLKLK